MIVQIANPIYDSVFKYLMEDERIAKTILSALLKKDVVSIQARPHEYSNQIRDSISMFRIDFSAKVQDADGSEHLILIELQKNGWRLRLCVSANISVRSIVTNAISVKIVRTDMQYRW